MFLSKWCLRASRNCSNWQASKLENFVQRTSNFQSSLSKIVDDGLANSEFAKTSELKNRMRKLVEYHTIEREPVQGRAMLFAYGMIEKPESISDQSLHQAMVLAWAVEMVQSYFLIMDDVEDGAKTRCGKPCWHLLPEVEILAMNDTSLFRSFIHETLKQNFSDPLCSKLVNIFNEAYLKIAVGQHLDVILAKSKDFSHFTQENYDTIVKYKCTYYSLNFPLMLALLLCDKADMESSMRIDDTYRDIGAFFQIQNDFMDCFDEESKTGKMGTDIQQGKCTWLAVQFLQRCDSEQRKIFEKCYGSWDPAHVASIRNMYNDSKLVQLFNEDKISRYESFMKKVQELPPDAVPSPKLFLNFLNAILNGP